MFFLPSYEAQPTSLLHTNGFDKVYPSVLGVLRFSQPLDIPRLKEALNRLSLTVPQIFCRYEIGDNRFYPVITDSADLFYSLKRDETPYTFPIDYQKGPQLAVFYQLNENGHQLTFIQSHIFADGAGLKEVMAYLVALYNDPDLAPKENHQDLQAILKNLPPVLSQNVKRADTSNISLHLPFPEAKDTCYKEVHQLIYPKDRFAKLHKKSKKAAFTINDCLLTAYMRMLATYNPAAERLPLACPTDTRQFLNLAERKDLHIGNFTARYNPQPAIDIKESFTVSLTKVHAEMSLLKEEHQFLQSTLTLIENYQTQSLEELRETAKQNYHARSIAYTNMQALQATNYTFAGTTLTDCFTAGAFRKAPMFQICFSTFEGRLNLVANVIGDQAQHAFADQLLQETIKQFELFLSE